LHALTPYASFVDPLRVRLCVCAQAIGEPPFFLAASVFFAIKDAVRAYRQQNGVTGPFELYR
jgi:xanthine dehydrogenase molybdopterin-binding subunit B